MSSESEVFTFTTYSAQWLDRIVELWNAVFRREPRSARIGSRDFYSRIVDRPVFDADGLILAVGSDRIAGMAHAFRPLADARFPYDNRRCREAGTIAVLAVHPEQRNRGIGSKLLARAEAYICRAPTSGKAISAGSFTETATQS